MTPSERPAPPPQRDNPADLFPSPRKRLRPLVREVASDLDTPLSVSLKLADGPHTYLFESVEGGERFGR